VEYQNKNSGNEVDVLSFKRFHLLELTKEEADAISEEVNTLYALRHENIIGIFGVSDDPGSVDGNGKHLGIGIMMEYCEKGSLRQYLNRKHFARYGYCDSYS
jgi:serine/threonine protein kinase